MACHSKQTQGASDRAAHIHFSLLLQFVTIKHSKCVRSQSRGYANEITLNRKINREEIVLTSERHLY